MSLLKAMQTNDTFTTNGMTTNSTSLNNCVDLFFNIGAMRGKNKASIINIFTKAFNEDQLVAMRLLFWVRDVRGGAGERQIFKDIIKYLATNHTEVLRKNIHLISEYGRWDDLLTLIDTPLQKDVLAIISQSVKDGDSLLAKWLPRPAGKNIKNKLIANVVRKHLGLSPKDYRKLLVDNSNTVEQLMCAKDFSKIDYSKLPSKAMSDLMKSFSRNDLVRFQEYLASLEKGETKINAGAIYPYDVLKNLKQGNHQGANLQWSALPNYMAGNTERIIPLVDVSGSMSCAAGGSGVLSCMDVAISLGLYISERNIGVFKDAFITFHANPQLLTVNGTLYERYNQMAKSSWGGNTNLEAVFSLILNKATKFNVSQEEMPTTLIILSDMQFDEATSTRYNGGSDWNPTAQEMIENMYSDAGYQVPKIVYWNLNARNTDSPVAYNKQDTCLVSGFNTSILKNILSGKDMTPMSIMMDVVDSDRYAAISV